MVALAANALTTLSAVKSDLSITDTTKDIQLTRIINAVSDYIENFTGRIFYRDAAIVEKAKGYGYAHLVVQRTPINSITQIKFRDAIVDSDDYSIDSAESGTIIKTGGWNWTVQTMVSASRPPVPGTERLLYEVTYDGGYYTPKQEEDNAANTRALPWDLEDAAIELVRQTYHAKSRDPNIASERLLSWSASYITENAPAYVKQALMNHKRLC